MAKLASRSLTIPEADTPRRDFVTDFVHSPRTSQKLTGDWRRIDGQKDERVPAAGVVALAKGIKQQTPTLSGRAHRELNTAFVLMSDLRGPTRYTGYNFLRGDKYMQHPTAPGKGSWRKDPLHGSHNTHDRNRSYLAAKTMRTALVKPGATPPSAVRAGGAAAGVYTLNEMSAPPRASNMRPERSLDEATLDEMECERELEKLKLRDEYGARMRRGTQPNTAEWSGGQGKRPKRSLSPSRVRAGESVDDYHHRLDAHAKKKKEGERKAAARRRSLNRE